MAGDPFGGRLLEEILTSGPKRRIEIMIDLKAMARRGVLAPMDETLAAARLESIAPADMVYLLRATFAFREALEQWRPFRTWVEDELRRRGADPAFVLRDFPEEERDIGPEAAPSAAATGL